MTKFIKLLMAAFLLASCSPKDENAEKANGNLVISTSGGDVYYQVENARAPQELETGLMNRDSLAEDAGMIFDLSHVSNKVAMWMKDTRISLDMLFVRPDGQIFWIFENAQPMSEEYIIAPEPAAAVIEINAGDVKKHNIQIGDTVKHEFFNNEVRPEDGDKLPPREEMKDEAPEMDHTVAPVEDVQPEAAVENQEVPLTPAEEVPVTPAEEVPAAE